MLKFKLIAIVVVNICISVAYADDGGVAAAIQETQTCLKNRTCDAFKTEAGQATIRKVSQAVHGDAASEQVLYDLSAEILPFVLQQSGGDPEKMQVLMQNPEAFLKTLPLDIQVKIRNTALAVEKVYVK
jgi:hypothetical protein